MPVNACAPLPQHLVFPQRKKGVSSSSAWTHRGRAGAEHLRVESQAGQQPPGGKRHAGRGSCVADFGRDPLSAEGAGRRTGA